MSNATVRLLVNEGTKILSENNIDSPANDSFEIFSSITGMTKTQYLINGNDEVTDEVKKEYLNLINKRASHIPLQHLTGKAYFYGLEFYVNESVLIPRFDTEILVETVLKQAAAGMSILDMCTGSGCIAITLAKNVDCKRIIAADISAEALKVADKNANNIGAQIQLIQSDIYSSVADYIGEGELDIIVSNPPYIRTKDIEELSDEVRIYDPYIALDGMEDGLHFYRKITEGAAKYLKKGGLLAYEIGYDQAKDVADIMKASGFEEISVIKDLAGLDRVVTARLS